jgi:hypothetical protein
MKITRLGMTESGLVFCLFLLKHYSNQMDENTKTQISNQIMNMVNWLYTTSGYYDKSVKGKHFNFDSSAMNANFYEFIKDLETALGGCEETHFFFHNHILQRFPQFKDSFIREYNIREFTLLNDTIFSDRMFEVFAYMKNRKVLVISSFDGLIQSQYESGNIFKVYEGFPKLESLQTVKSPYCFENNGPHENYRETLNDMFEKIKKLDFDIAVLGCGCYGHMLTHKIHAELDKDAIYLGGSITNLFGILTTREKNANRVKPNEFWITNIPEEYRPENYKNIENGCYW